MCGIIGAVTQRPISNILIDGLRRLEYRGYDSAGLAIYDDGHLVVRKVAGKVQGLADQVESVVIPGRVGIAHTRWATHGPASLINAHPHLSDNQLAIVHNGIIENHTVLKAELAQDNIHCQSDTDSEVLAHLIQKYCRENDNDWLLAVRKTIAKLQGSFAMAIVHRAHPDEILVAKHASPLLIGIGVDEYFAASDSQALAHLTGDFIDLQDGDMARLSHNGFEVWDKTAQRVERKPFSLSKKMRATGKGPYRHYMQKEINEQPQVITDALKAWPEQQKLLESIDLANIEHIRIVGCGTSYHAGLIAKYWLEERTGVLCDVEMASELRYRNAIVPKNTLLVAVSQSGETADTLAVLTSPAALQYAAKLAICNVPHSSLTRAVETTLLTHAGMEVSVASTKAFSSQLFTLYQLSLRIGMAKGLLDEHAWRKEQNQLQQLPVWIEHTLCLNQSICALSERLIHKQQALFLGRGIHYPLVKEGALKLKEISYIHAEAYPAGELKHGPLALVDQNLPVIAVVPNDPQRHKIIANLEEVKARGGEFYVLAEPGMQCNELPGEVLHLPEVPSSLTPFVYIIPLQLLAYHVAHAKGFDVDQPRNLAKSVTVE